MYYIREEEPCFTIAQREDYLQFSFFITVECELGISQYQINEDSEAKNQTFKASRSPNDSIRMEDNEFELSLRGDHLQGVANILNERDLNSKQNSGDKRDKTFGHRRYGDNTKENKEPLNSSRFFLNRVASKNSSFDEYE